MSGPAPRPAKEARSDELMELVALVRRELVRRGEFLPPRWVDEAVDDLRRGRLSGWFYSEEPGPAGIAFLSFRPHRAYGHVHVEAGPKASDRAFRLVEAMVAGFPEAVRRVDVGITGLSSEEEAHLVGALRSAPGGSFLTRIALERGLREPPAPPLPSLPAPLHHWPVRKVPLEGIQTLDWSAFRGTADETLIADTPAENLRLLGEILDGKLGLFLDEASTVLADEEGRLVGAVLSAQQSAQRAIVLDLMVDPKGRRRGIGTYLLCWTMRAMLALGYETVFLWVTEGNQPARRIYERLGFRARLTALIYRWNRVPEPTVHTRTAPETRSS